MVSQCASNRVKSELANSHLTFTVKKMTIQRKEMVKIMNLFQWLQIITYL